MKITTEPPFQPYNYYSLGVNYNRKIQTIRIELVFIVIRICWYKEQPCQQ